MCQALLSALHTWTGLFLTAHGEFLLLFPFHRRVHYRRRAHLTGFAQGVVGAPRAGLGLGSGGRLQAARAGILTEGREGVGEGSERTLMRFQPSPSV